MMEDTQTVSSGMIPKERLANWQRSQNRGSASEVCGPSREDLLSLPTVSKTATSPNDVMDKELVAQAYSFAPTLQRNIVGTFVLVTDEEGEFAGAQIELFALFPAMLTWSQFLRTKLENSPLFCTEFAQNPTAMFYTLQGGGSLSMDLSAADGLESVIQQLRWHYEWLYLEFLAGKANPKAVSNLPEEKLNALEDYFKERTH